MSKKPVIDPAEVRLNNLLKKGIITLSEYRMIKFTLPYGRKGRISGIVAQRSEQSAHN